jgi:hypothetical protein
MSNALSIIFGRNDRTPADHHYGDEVDDHRHRSIGGSANLRLDDPIHPRAPMMPNPGDMVLHETGPMIIIDADDVENASPTLDAARQIARVWAARKVDIDRWGEPWAAIRYGPATNNIWDWRLHAYTTDPLTLASELDVLVEFIMRRHRERR